MKVVLYGSPVTPFRKELADRLSDDWTICCVDDATQQADRESAFRDADAAIAVNFDDSAPPSPKLRLLQVPHAQEIHR